MPTVRGPAAYKRQRGTFPTGGSEINEGGGGLCAFGARWRAREPRQRDTRGGWFLDCLLAAAQQLPPGIFAVHFGSFTI